VEDQARNACTKVVNEISTHVWPLVSSDGSTKPEEFRANLETIVSVATKLDLDMKLQFPHYHIVMPPPGRASFDAAEMKVASRVEAITKEGEGMRRGDEVGLVESPILFKLGKWDGSDFDRPRKVIEKAVVMPRNALAILQSGKNNRFTRSGTSSYWSKFKGSK
jgi:hypothetical protein